jgi:hypothetical protein
LQPRGKRPEPRTHPLEEEGMVDAFFPSTMVQSKIESRVVVGYGGKDKFAT